MHPLADVRPSRSCSSSLLDRDRLHPDRRRGRRLVHGRQRLPPRWTVRIRRGGRLRRSRPVLSSHGHLRGLLPWVRVRRLRREPRLHRAPAGLPLEAPGAQGSCGDAGGGACGTDADCGATGICGFAEKDGCSAEGRCFPAPGAVCQAYAAGCACDGTLVNIACTGLPSGYASRPLAHAGPCLDASGGSDGAACCPAGWGLYSCTYPDGGGGLACHNPALGCASSFTCGDGCDFVVEGACDDASPP